MRATIVFVFIWLLLSSTFAQVAINTTGNPPHSSAALDIQFNNRGMRIPNVSLTSAIDNTTIPSPVLSLLVYNTSTSGTGNNQVTPGYYYWNGSRWIRLLTNAYSWAGAVIGNLSPFHQDLTTVMPGIQYLNTYITLPPGRWIVYIVSLMKPQSSCWVGTEWDHGGCGDEDPINDDIWVRYTLSDCVNCGFSGDIEGGTLVSGSVHFPQVYNIASGIIRINNTTGANKTYYLHGNIERHSTQSNLNNVMCNGCWGEDQLFAIPAE